MSLVISDFQQSGTESHAPAKLASTQQLTSAAVIGIPAISALSTSTVNDNHITDGDSARNSMCSPIATPRSVESAALETNNGHGSTLTSEEFDPNQALTLAVTEDTGSSSDDSAQSDSTSEDDSLSENDEEDDGQDMILGRIESLPSESSCGDQPAGSAIAQQVAENTNEPIAVSSRRDQPHVLASIHEVCYALIESSVVANIPSVISFSTCFYALPVAPCHIQVIPIPSEIL